MANPLHSDDAEDIELHRIRCEVAVADLEGVPWVPWNPLLKSCLRSIASVRKRSTQQRTPHFL